MTRKKQLRREMRRRRRTLDHHTRARAGAGLAAGLARLHLFLGASRVAVFVANDGEIDPALVMRRFPGKRYFLPVVPPAGQRRMRFAPLGATTRWRRNRYGIPEPDVASNRLVTALELDVTLAPLVAFDRSGGRLGMGGGYYDATFAFLNSRRRWVAPALVGVAFAFQEVSGIQRDPWDVPLSAVVTERGPVPLAAPSRSDENV